MAPAVGSVASLGSSSHEKQDADRAYQGKGNGKAASQDQGISAR